MALSARIRLFIEEYLTCWNATEAARRAGYSEKTAYSQGHRLLKKADVQAAIEARIAEVAMSANEVLLRLADHARGDMSDFIHPDSLTVDLREADRRRKLHLIKKIKYVTKTDDDSQTETIEFELYDAQAALVHLGRYHKLFTDRQEQDTNIEIGLKDDDRRAIENLFAGLATEPAANSEKQDPAIPDTGAD